MITRNIKERIKEYFFLNPLLKLRVRQIERQVKVSLPSVIRYTKELEKEGIIKRSEFAGINVYSADRNSKFFLNEKKLYNIFQLHASGLIDFILGEFSSPTLIVFGSYSRGEDIENSDIDLYLETPAAKKISIEKFEKKLQRKIQIFQYPRIQQVKNSGLANNIINGVILNGFVEVFK